VFLLPAAIAGAIAWGLWGGDARIVEVEVEKVRTVEVERVVTVEVLVEVPVEKIVTRIVQVTPEPTPDPCPNDAEREYLTSLGYARAARETAWRDLQEVTKRIDDDPEVLLDPEWQESAAVGIANMRETTYDILKLNVPSSMQGIQVHMVDWARHEFARLDVLRRFTEAESFAGLSDLLAETEGAIDQHIERRDASLDLVFEEIEGLCESLEAALSVYQAARVITPSTTSATTPTPMPTATPAPVPTVTVEELTDAWANNSIAADRTYKGKFFDIEGHLSSIDTWFGEVNVTLDDGSLFAIGGVQCAMKGGQEDELSKLDKGDEIVLRGTITGEALIYIGAEDCVLVKMVEGASRTSE